MASSRSRLNEDSDSPYTGENPPPELDPQQHLIGVMLDVPDRLWGIETTAEQHPGACIRYLTTKHSGVLLKGTSSDNVRPDLRWRYYFVEPDETNGLMNETAFDCAPRYVRRHLLRLLHADRVRGQLSSEDLASLQEHLHRIYGL